LEDIKVGHLVKNETKMVLKKPVQALVMIPKVGKLTVVARKLYNVVLHSALQQIAEFKNLGKEVPATHLFSARLRDLLDPIEAGTSNLTALAKIHFKEMLNTQIEWDSPEAKKGSIWGASHLLSEANLKYELGVDSKVAPLIAEWAFPPSIMKTLVDPELYAQLNIFQIAKLTSYETLVLYEICTRYRTNFEGLTNKNAPEWWVRALSNKQPSIDPETNIPKVRPWAKFKDDKIKEAIAEINSKTDLDIELIEERAGKKITAVQFKVTRKESDAAEEISTLKLSSDIAEQVAKLGLSIDKVLGLVKNGLSENVLKVGLLKLEARIAREELEPIDSKMAYLKSVVMGADKHIAKTTVPDEKKASPPSSTIPLNSKEQIRAQIKAELLALLKVEQKQYAAEALNELRESGALSPSVTRAFESAEWLKNGYLLSKMVEVYAIATRGPEWFNGPAKEA
jgi:hypothetical protein